MTDAKEKQMNIIPLLTADQRKQNNPTPDEAWFNAAVYLKNVDLQQEFFTVRSFFNIYWNCSDNNKYSKDTEINMIPLMEKDQAQYLAIMNTTPVIAECGLDWFLYNAAHDVTRIMKFTFQHYSKHNKSRLDIIFEADFNETFELEQFPFDAQFLNMKLKLNPIKYTFLSTVPDWLKDVEYRGPSDIISYHHERPISVVILQPADKEWILLKPWIDFRRNPNTAFCLIRLRVKRRANKYLWNNIVPLIMITGLSFLYISIEDQNNKLAFISTLLLTIAAGRSELVTPMPLYCGPTKIDKFVLCGYFIFAVQMVGIAALGDNHCGAYNWGEGIEEQDTKYCVATMVIFIGCLLVWLFAICYLFINTCAECCCSNECCKSISRDNKDFWEIRSEKEFKTWRCEQILTDMETVDEDHMFGTDHATWGSSMAMKPKFPNKYSKVVI
eukprot:92480_1